MGAWGHKSFENDDASDWVYDFEEGGIGAVKDAFAGVLNTAADDYLEAPEASMALAAAEVVAAARDGDTSRLSEPAANAFRGHGDWTGIDDLVAAAGRAIDRILQASELRELWEETDDYADWQADVAALKSRLR